MAKKTEPKTAKKAVCPVTKDEFNGEAKPLRVTIDGKEYVANPKEFKTGSFGWYLSDKLVANVNGTPVKTQLSVLLTVVGSKDS